jgi:cobalt-zinc-cadmium efflux system membrane fusion protein
MELELMNLDIPALDAGQIQKSTHLTAPISGYFDKWMVNPGQYIEQNSSMGLIVNKDRLFVELMVFEKDVRFVKLGQRVTFEMANLGEEEYEAKVLTIGKMVEENARTVKVTAEFLNSSPIVLPGMFVAAEIHTSEQNLDALPEEAVVMEEETSFCYYTTDPEKSASIRYKKIPVRTGFKEDGYIQTELLQPLPPGARIVIKGAYFIKAEGLKQGETD